MSVQDSKKKILNFYLIITGQEKVWAQVPIHFKFIQNDFKNTLGLLNNKVSWYNSNAGKDQYIYNNKVF